MIYQFNRNLISLRKSEYIINRNPNVISLQIFREYKDPNKETFRHYFKDVNIKRSELLERADYVDSSLFGFYVRESTLDNLEGIALIFDQAEELNWTVQDLKQRLEEALQYSINNFPLTAYTIVNMTAITEQAKSNLINMRNIVSGIRLMQFFVPFTDMKFDQMPLSIVAYPDAKVTANEEITLLNNDTIIGNEKIMPWIKENSIVPDLEFSADGVTRAVDDEIVVAPDQYVDVTLKLVHNYTRELITGHPVQLFLENINGYLPKNRLIIDADTGKVKFRVGALGLTDGDNIRIKVGFRYYTGVSDITLKVVDPNVEK